MAFEISLMVGGQANKYVRNGEPGLRDMTNALKVQQQQLRMYAKETGPTNADFDANEANLANFAVAFWQGQFTRDQIIDGAVASLKSMDSINSAIDATLGGDEENGDEAPAKKSPTRTSKTRSTASTTSTKQD